MMRWLLIPGFCRETGYTEDAVRTKIKRGIWLEGIIWRKAPDGRIHINIEEYQKWVEGKVHVPLATRQSKSILCIEASAAGNG
jgi:hypothetical protein